MGFSSVKCPSCGANVELDNSREFGFCTYCGTKIIQDKIIVEHRGSVTIKGVATKETLLERAQIMLKDGGFTNANTYFDRVLDIDPHCAAAYFGKELCTIRIRDEAELANYNRSILNDSFYLKALDFAANDERKRYAELGNMTQESQNRVQESQYQQQKQKCHLAYKKSLKKVISRLSLIPIIMIGLLLITLYVYHDSETNNATVIKFALQLGVGMSAIVEIPLLCFSIGEFRIIKLYRKNKVFKIPSTFKWR